MPVDEKQLISLDKRYLWHPYTPMQEYLESVEPLVVTRADGARLFDHDGRSYIDGNSSWWTALLGHGHPRLVEALCRQARTLAHTSLAGITHEPAARLAQELAEVAPEGLDRVFFSDDGSTSVEVAMKLALQYWAQNGRPERRRFLALDGAFHGETLGVTALGGVEVFRRPFASVVLDCVHVPTTTDGHERAFAALEKALQEGADSLAAVVLEPMVQGAAGMQIYDAEYLRRARELTTRHDVFLILDEVFTGYGRTGPMWAGSHAGVIPDISCTAKGFSGGMLPMAATLATQRIFDGFLGDPSRAFFYGHTYCGNPLGAAVAREVLAIYREEDVLGRAAPKAERIRRTFAELEGVPGVSRSRSLGMIGALDLPGDGYLDRAGRRVYEEGLRRGAYLRPLGNVVYLAPPLTIPDEDLDELLGIFAESVRTVLA
ncbi:MAG: adenosylmethionine--8-amino-7-oxononanoate transaminase [Myxococcales bacterium]|nr:adenosylmethionine--8-amino-7-oxononanoate transaminase [Myxococcales bacterium]MCB9576375.1 adenosylmethionine--8-amino-7-oxononanoate transaminase [Polyangiaceae bacterium]